MVQVPERRQFPRLSTGPDYRVRFRVGGREITEARLRNVCAAGCGLQVAMADAASMETGHCLEALCVDHSWLPYVPLEGQVIQMLGKVAGKTSGYVLVGVVFTAITPLVQDLIQAHVEESLSRPQP